MRDIFFILCYSLVVSLILEAPKPNFNQTEISIDENGENNTAILRRIQPNSTFTGKFSEIKNVIWVISAK